MKMCEWWMTRSLIRDRVARNRDVDLSDYLRGEAMAHGEGIPAAGERNISEGCQPAPGLRARRGESWSAYVANITACEDAEWREFTQVAGLMRDRIHHMLHKLKPYSQ